MIPLIATRNHRLGMTKKVHMKVCTLCGGSASQEPQIELDPESNSNTPLSDASN